MSADKYQFRTFESRVVPTCEKGCTKGEYHIGSTCPQCSTLVRVPSPLEPVVPNNGLLSAEDYQVLQLGDRILNGEIARVLNHNGAARFTVCPLCRLDDFTHVEGCRLFPKADDF